MLEIEKNLLDEFNIKVRIGFEMEFYVDETFKPRSADENGFLANILLGLTRMEITTLSIDREVAEGQYEISLEVENVTKALENYEHLKNIIQRACDKYKRKALFEAKPFDNLPGSGLHVHIGLIDSFSEKNLLMRKGKEKEEESDIMRYAIGGLCSTMIKDFCVFAPHDNSYRRFTAAKNQLVNDEATPLSAYNNAPVNVSWGGNNRTTALRIPASTIDETKRHIEHRVAGVDADASQVVEKILEGIYIGLKGKIEPPEKIYGNAYDEQYSFLEPFPESLEKALNINHNILN